MIIFQENEHLSEAVKVCKAAVQKMVTRIEQTQDTPASTFMVDSGVDVAESGYSDLLQDLPYHFDFESLFNPE